MATYRCKSCDAAYTNPQPDGSSYFHSCAPVHNPDYDAQFELDAEGNRVPKGPLDPDIPEMLERPDKRDENIVVQPDGKTRPKETGKGRDTIEEEAPVRLRKTLAVLAFLWWGFLSPAHAQQAYNTCATFSTADVTLVTTAETVVAASEECRMPGRPVKVIIKFYGVVTTGADSATVKVRIRRDTVAGTALGDALAETVKVTAGGIEPFVMMATDERAGTLNSVKYVATLEIASASANSTVGQAYIEVVILG